MKNKINSQSWSGTRVRERVHPNRSKVPRTGELISSYSDGLSFVRWDDGTEELLDSSGVEDIDNEPTKTE